MARRVNLTFFIVIVLLLNLAGCSGLTSLKREPDAEPKQDLFELQKQADAAYLGDNMVASESDYETLIQEIPEIAVNWFRLGNIYARTNRPVAAIDLYREALIRDPTFGKAWYNMSLLHLKQTAYSLNEMMLYVDANDPIYNKARALLDGIQGIIQQDDKN